MNIVNISEENSIFISMVVFLTPLILRRTFGVLLPDCVFCI